MDALALTFSSGWASGINAWATVFVLGLLGRFAGTDAIPAGFERTDVLALMGVLALLVALAAVIVGVAALVWLPVSLILAWLAGAVTMGFGIAGVGIVANPIVHVGGLWGILQSMQDRRRIVLLERFRVDPWVEVIREFVRRATLAAREITGRCTR